MATNAATIPEPAAGPSDIDWYAVIDVLDVPKCDKEGMKEWIRQSEARNLEILVTGRTGTGKSTLVNALVGRKVAEEGHGLRRKTEQVTDYALKTNDGFNVLVWDSPGLQDGTVNEEQYLAEMKEKCSNVDIVIYAVDISKTRSALKERSDQSFQSDYSAIQKLTRTFGVDWWKNVVFVLTFANRLEAMLRTRFSCQLESKFKERIEEWKCRICASLSEAGVPKEIADNVAIEPAGHFKKPHLPGHEYWLSILWFTFLSRTKRHSQPILVKMNANRFRAASSVSLSAFTSNESHEQPIIVNKGTVAAATLTIAGSTAMAASIGTGIGAGIGAVVGLAGFGIGAAIGAGFGAVAGGALGTSVGILYYLYEKHKSNVSVSS